MWTKLLVSVNRFLFRMTHGAIGSRMAGQSVLLLNTVGHKTGQLRTTPLNYFSDDNHYILVASNWGKENHPAWYYNLLHQPEATIQVKNRTIEVKARLAQGEEFDRLWSFVTGKNPFYASYQAKTRRKIPIVVLEPC